MKKIVAILTALGLVASAGSMALPVLAEEAPVQGGTVNIPITGDPTTLQGWMLRNTNENVLATAIYETLLRYDENGIPQPYLCESFEGDPEALTYTIKLKDGITFQDGTAFDADAVVWNLDYYKENGCLSGSYFGEYESSEAVDESTVVVHLSSWNALFNYGLARSCYMCSPTAVQELGADGFNEAPIGTGAFKVSKWEHGEGIYTEKYADYWQGEPLLDSVNFIIYSSVATQQAALEKGDLDIINLSGDAVTAEALEAKGYTLTNAAIPATAYTFCFNTQADTPLADVRVRQAICYAIDADKIVSALLRDGKFGTSSNQWAIPGTSMFNDEVQGYGYDVEAAKKLLEEANYDSDYVLTINYQVGDFMGQLAQICGSQLEAIGIKVELNAIEVANYVNYFGEWDGILFHQMGLANGQFSQVAANMITGINFGSKTFTHRQDTLDLIAEANVSDDETLAKDLKEAVRILFDETVDLYTVAITYTTAVTGPGLHSDYGTIQQNRATWHEMWKEAE